MPPNHGPTRTFRGCNSARRCCAPTPNWTAEATVPLYLDHIQAIKDGELFYFSRLDAIKPSNKEITFTTKLGPMEFKAKFTLKDMMYRGKLEL